MNIAPGQGQTDPRGQSLDVNRNVLSLRSFVASFKKMSLKSDFKHFFFHDLGRGKQKGLIKLPICCKFQINLFDVSFYTILS